MAVNLKHLIHSMFRNKYERTMNEQKLKPYFYRFIGVDDTKEYDDLIKTLQKKCLENQAVTLIFDNQIPFKPEMELIQYIYNELTNMDIGSMVSQDIIIFDDQNINKQFLLALDYVIPLAKKKENFFSDSVLRNFITKLIVWAYILVKEIEFNYDLNPKCIYYGNIQRHEVYFLIVLYLMDFDVIYLNPLKEEFFEEIEESRLSECIKSMAILSIDTLEEHAKKGKEIESVETIAKQIEREVQKQLFTGTGMYTPWQFRDGYTRSILLDGIFEDISIYWKEQCKLRDGFRVDGDTVTVPCLFKKVDGVYNNLLEYQRVLKYCVNYKNTILCLNGDISEETKVTQDMYQLMFCQLSDGTFDVEGIKTTPMYKFSKYSDEVQNFLLNKFNECIQSKNLYTEDLSKESCLELLVMILSLNERIVRLIDNFDFTADIPKLVVFLEGENGISKSMQRLLGYLHIVGMDIVIFNPSGSLNLKHVLNNEVFTEERLQVMKYDMRYKDIINLKQGIFSKIFK